MTCLCIDNNNVITYKLEIFSVRKVLEGFEEEVVQFTFTLEGERTWEYRELFIKEFLVIDS